MRSIALKSLKKNEGMAEMYSYSQYGTERACLHAQPDGYLDTSVFHRTLRIALAIFREVQDELYVEEP
jgi:hypothetical protein